MSLQVEESSFRDRDGFVFFENNRVFRAIQPSYFKTWDDLSASGLLRDLSESGKIVSFNEVLRVPELHDARVLEVEEIPFISYPSEWTFSQLKKAAILTLDLQLMALEKGFILKDASAFNVQFKSSKALFIDLLSFEHYEEGRPWMAYRQFCTHFLCPLLLYKYNIPQVRQLSSAHLDGIPLDVCSALLPLRSHVNLLAYTHIHMHTRMQKKHESSAAPKASQLRLSKKRLVTMLVHMKESIRQIRSGGDTTNWTSYYEDFSYSKEGFEFKKKFVADTLRDFRPQMCLDLGCNTGEFTQIASEFSEQVVSCDSDEEVVRLVQRKKIQNVLALCVDLTDPTPSRGWNHKERKSFFSRAGQADCVLALALVHHLSIGNNVPLTKLSKFFSRFKNLLIIEFVPKDDPQVKRLLVSRKDVFDNYTETNFISAFSDYFIIEKKERIPASDRSLYVMKRKDS